MNPAARPAGYMLCASPRSGSTLLCDLLTQSGVAGVPKSYFRPASVSGFAHDWGIDLGHQSWNDRYVTAVRQHGTGGTGCFGMRIMWGDMPEFLQRLGTRYPTQATEAERLHSALGVDHFIHLSRDDRVAQAVSLVLASQTGLWHRNTDGSERQRSAPPQESRYDRDQIATQLAMLEAEATRWQSWFASAEIKPLTLTYEQLAGDPTGSLALVLRSLGSTIAAIPETGTAKLADQRNDDWATRFRSETETAP